MMKKLTVLSFYCMLVLAGCMEQPDPITDLNMKITGVSATTSSLTADASINNAYGGSNINEWGISLWTGNGEQQRAIATGSSTFKHTFNGLANPENYAVRAYAVIGNKTFYGDPRRANGINPIDPEPGGTPASVTVNDFIAISDGFYLYFMPSENTKNYYWSSYTNGELYGMSDAQIIADLQANGVHASITDEYQEGYSWNLSSQTNYTIYIVAFDHQGQQGKLTQKVISTQSGFSQPVANINVLNINHGTACYNIYRNTYCRSFVYELWYGVSQEDINAPDILWAATLHEYKQDNISVYEEDLSYECYSNDAGLWVIATLGYTSSGENSGILTKKIFNTQSGSIYPAPLNSKNKHSAPENKQVTAKKRRLR